MLTLHDGLDMSRARLSELVRDRKTARNDRECPKLDFSRPCSTILSPSASPSLYECVSHAFPKLQVSYIVCLSQGGAALVLKTTYNGHDVFLWLPSGYGKSHYCQALRTVSRVLQERSLFFLATDDFQLCVE